MIKVRNFTITISSVIHMLFSIWLSSCAGSLTEQELENLWRVAVAEAFSIHSSHQKQRVSRPREAFLNQTP